MKKCDYNQGASSCSFFGCSPVAILTVSFEAPRDFNFAAPQQTLRWGSELQTQPNLHSPVWAGRNDTDQHTHTQIWSLTPPGNTSHFGTNTPNSVLSRWGWPAFDLLKRGCTNLVVGLELAESVRPIANQKLCQQSRTLANWKLELRIQFARSGLDILWQCPKNLLRLLSRKKPHEATKKTQKKEKLTSWSCSHACLKALKITSENTNKFRGNK